MPAILVVNTKVHVRFHLDSAHWIPDRVKERVHKLVGYHLLVLHSSPSLPHSLHPFSHLLTPLASYLLQSLLTLFLYSLSYSILPLPPFSFSSVLKSPKEVNWWSPPSSPVHSSWTLKMPYTSFTRCWKKHLKFPEVPQNWPSQGSKNCDLFYTV